MLVSWLAEGARRKSTTTLATRTRIPIVRSFLRSIRCAAAHARPAYKQHLILVSLASQTHQTLASYTVLHHAQRSSLAVRIKRDASAFIFVYSRDAHSFLRLRAGGNGTAGAAMAVLVSSPDPTYERGWGLGTRLRPYRILRGEKWRRLDSNLRMRYRMAPPSGSP